MQGRVEKQEFNPQRFQVVAADVSQKTLDWYTEETGADGKVLERQSRVANRTGEIGELLGALLELAGRNGKSLMIVCEPSGGYERKLTRLARARGAATWYVSGEATHKLTILESNDTGKNDPKDARVIYRIAMLRTSLLTDCQTWPGYEQMRELNQFYEDEDDQIVQIRNGVCAALRKLFCDLSFSNEFVFTKTGQAFVDLYGGNPARVVADGWERFQRRLKQRCPRARGETLHRLWKDAQSSALLMQSAGLSAVWEERLAALIEDWKRHELRKDGIREQMRRLYERLPECNRLTGTGISDFALARIVAETGPLNQYRCWPQLLRMAGLNLRVRQSGQYKGVTRISKKGRALLRKVLYQQAFGVLTQPRGLYAKYFKRRREGDHPVPAKKLYVNIMRKFLRALFGAYHSGGFTSARVFLDQVHYERRKVA